MIRTYFGITAFFQHKRRVNHAESCTSHQNPKDSQTKIDSSVYADFGFSITRERRCEEVQLRNVRTSINHNDFAPFNSMLQEMMCNDIGSFMDLSICKFSEPRCRRWCFHYTEPLRVLNCIFTNLSWIAP